MVNMAVAGKTQFGKSYLIKQRVIPKIKKVKPVVIFDRKAEYGGSMAKDVPENWKTHKGIEEFFKAINEEFDNKIKGVHVILCEKDPDYINGISFFRALLDEKEETPVTIILEEAHDIILNNRVRKAKDALTQCVRYGLSKKLNFIFISQRMKDLQPDIRSQCDALICFRQNADSDIQALTKDFGVDNAEKVLNLKRKQYIYKDLPKELNNLKETDYAR